MPDEVNIRFNVDDHGLNQASENIQKLERQSQSSFGNAEKAAGGFSGALGNIASTAAGFIAANVVMGAFNEITGAIHGAFSSAIEFEQIQAQTAAVLKSTGGAAGMTAESVKELAASLEAVTPFSDEAVQSTENLLLTFTSIGKDIFPQATETVLDMATALGEDTKSAAIQLGKALQDPVLGVTALRRVGVNFNDAQKEVIKTMVETGDTAGAQALIMQELQKEFGGSARAAGETFGGQLAILKHNLGDVARDIVMVFLPALASAAKWLNENLVTGVEAAKEGLHLLAEVLRGPIDAGLSLLSQGFDEVVKRLQPFTPVIGAARDILKGFVDQAIDFGHRIKSEVVPAVLDFAGGALGKMVDFIGRAIPKVLEFASAHKTLVGFILGGPLGAAIGFLITHWGNFVDLMGNVRDRVSELVSGPLANLRDGIKGVFEAFQNGPQAGFEALHIPDSVIDGFKRFKDMLGDFGEKLARIDSKDVLQFFRDLGNSIADLAASTQPLIDLFRPLVEDIFKELADAVAPIGKAFKDDLLPALQELIPAGQAMLPVLKVIGEVLGVILVAAIYAVLEALKLLIPIVAEVLVIAIKALALQIQLVAEAIKIAAPVIMTLVEALKAIGSGVVQAAINVFEDFKNIVESTKPLWPAISAAIKLMGDDIKLVWDTVKIAAEAAWSQIKIAIQTALGVIEGLFHTFKGLLTGDWEEMWNGLKEVASSIWEGIKAFFETGLTALKQIFQNVIPDLKQIAEDMIGGMRDVLEGGWDKLRDGVWAMKDKLISGLGNVKDWLVDVGWDLVRGIAQGITDGGPAIVKSAVDKLSDLIPGWAKDALSILSPSKVMRDEVGIWISAGIAEGITAGSNKIHDALNSVTDGMIEEWNSKMRDLNQQTGGSLQSWRQLLQEGLDQGKSMSTEAISVLLVSLKNQILNSDLPLEGKALAENTLAGIVQTFQNGGGAANSALIEIINTLLKTATDGAAKVGAAVASAAKPSNSGANDPFVNPGTWGQGGSNSPTPVPGQNYPSASSVPGFANGQLPAVPGFDWNFTNGGWVLSPHDYGGVAPGTRLPGDNSEGNPTFQQDVPGSTFMPGFGWVPDSVAAQIRAITSKGTGSNNPAGYTQGSNGSFTTPGGTASWIKDANGNWVLAANGTNGPSTPAVQVNIENVTATNEQEAAAAGGNIGFAVASQLQARGAA